MDADALCFLPLVEVGRRIRARTLSSVDVTRAVLDRIARLDPRLHAYATVTPERALEAAARADAEIAAGRWRGPLHGVPVAVKDLCDTAGVVTAAGTKIRRDVVPARDATVVARLLDAGAVPLGKLQMTEGAFSQHHPSIVPPVNPWSDAHWTGVSSSGSGVATAAGLCFGALGSDTLGSIRFPSTMNGLTGLKPTWGRVSRAGVFPLAGSLDHVGPMTRCAEDAAAMFAAIAGEDADDPTALRAPVPDDLSALRRPVRGLRIGVDRALVGAGADDATGRVIDDAAGTFARLGASVRDVTFPSTDAIVRDAVLLCAVEAAAAHAQTFPSRRDDYGPVLAQYLDTGRAATGIDLALVAERRAAFAGRVSALWRDVDLLLMPTMNVAAPTLALLAASRRDPDGIFGRVRFTAPFNMTGSPSLTLPGGATPDGFPLAFQLVGRHLDEALLLQAGHAYQTATDWHARTPRLD